MKGEITLCYRDLSGEKNYLYKEANSPSRLKLKAIRQRAIVIHNEVFELHLCVSVHNQH